MGAFAFALASHMLTFDAVMGWSKTRSGAG